MRVAPVGLFYAPGERTEIDRIGAQAAAVTHGHSLGYIPASVLTHIINVAVYGETHCWARWRMPWIRRRGCFVRTSTGRCCRHWWIGAEALSGNNVSNADNIHALGGGWVADETLAIFIYCALRYSDNFSKGIIAAMNHSGDSDSTSAVTGNILGAWLGCEAIEEKWTWNLELRRIILEMADDLCFGCLLDEYHDAGDPKWIRKYVEVRYDT